MVAGPGDDLLSHVLRRSTMGATGFHGRVRKGIGWGTRAMATRSSNHPATPPSLRLGGDPGPPAHGADATRDGTEVVKLASLLAWAALLVRLSLEGVEVDRAIRTGKLHALPRFHIRPIDVVVYHGSRRDLVLRRVSRLDAFSGYPVRT